jgi:hypothetical protein
MKYLREKWTVHQPDIELYFSCKQITEIEWLSEEWRHNYTHLSYSLTEIGFV